MILPLDDQLPIGPFAQPRPSMRGRYLIRNAIKARAVGAMDLALSLVPRRGGAMPGAPERILVANWAHMGDVITSTGALGALRERYPDARIGALVGSWGRAAVEKTGLADSIHVIDHWMLNRGELSAAAKRERFSATRAVALKEIRAADYQVGIDLFAYFPPAHPLFFKAGIPVRIGYTSGGFGPLLTHPVRWTDRPGPMADQYRDLLDRLDPARPFDPALLRPTRSRTTLAALPADLRDAGRYIVVHPGAGTASRHWGAERWNAVIARLQQERPDHQIVLTGAGPAETTLADQLCARHPGLLSMVGRAGWEEFVRILADASLVICPDTATGHVAALFEVPTVCIFTGTNRPDQWAPYNERLFVLTRPVLCAPCNLPGCEAMACFRGVEPDDVVNAALTALTTGI